MKFRSPTDKPVFLAVTSGHTCVVGPSLTEVPTRFQRAAVAEGCIPEGMDSLPPADDTGNETPSETKQALLVAAMRKMVATPKDGDFNNDGRPDVRRVSAYAGFTAMASDRDAAWAALNDEE